VSLIKIVLKSLQLYHENRRKVSDFYTFIGLLKSMFISPVFIFTAHMDFRCISV